MRKPGVCRAFLWVPHVGFARDTCVAELIVALGFAPAGATHFFLAKSPQKRVRPRLGRKTSLSFDFPSCSRMSGAAELTPFGRSDSPRLPPDIRCARRLRQGRTRGGLPALCRKQDFLGALRKGSTNPALWWFPPRGDLANWLDDAQLIVLATLRGHGRPLRGLFRSRFGVSEIGNKRSIV